MKIKKNDKFYMKGRLCYAEIAHRDKTFTIRTLFTYKYIGTYDEEKLNKLIIKRV